MRYVELGTPYAGIGSRETPDHALVLMTRIAAAHARRGYVLRSGAAPGADAAFERGVPLGGLKDIWLPWLGFQGHTSRLLPSPEAYVLAEHYHPAWDRCSKTAKDLHARNSHQVLGGDLKSPVSHVICWTPNGAGGGGTGQAIRIARARKIPVFDLALPSAEAALRLWLS